MARIHGILNNASGVRPNTKIILISQKTSTQVLAFAPDMLITTDASGAYDFECKVGKYSLVITQSGYARENVGTITVYLDSNDGSLEDFILEGQAINELTPDAVSRVEALEKSAKQSAESATASAATATQKASEASNSAATAITKAGESLSSANAAKVSEDNAKASELNAQQSSDKLASISTNVVEMQKIIAELHPLY